MLASAGPFAVAVIAHVIAAVILLVLLRPDPLLASRDAAEEVAEPAAGWRVSSGVCPPGRDLP
ncbi:MAG: hypothetical protein M3502_03230 [Actinomycetota bacterium]|nr:hypothetical protein [Actinomycetota bacterium]